MEREAKIAAAGDAMVAACMAADLDVDERGYVSEETIVKIRAALQKAGQS